MIGVVLLQRSHLQLSAWRAALLDAASASVAFGLAWWIRYTASSGGWITGGPPHWENTLGHLAVGIALSGWLVGRRGWGPIVSAGVAAATGGVLAVAAIWTFTGFDALPRGVFASTVWLSFLMQAAWRSLATLPRDDDADVDAALVPPRRPVRWITALGHHRTLLRLLVARDLKLKYRGSFVGFLWSLANPLVMTATYTVAFTYIFPVRGEGFIFILLVGVLAWTFFATSAGMATGAIVDSGSLIKSVYFPRVVLPAATVLFTFVQYLLAMVVLLPAMFALYRLTPGWPLLLLPVVLAALGVFTFGVALLMAAATAAFRDVRHLLDIALQVLFWATPILYTADAFPAPVAALVAQSPLGPFIEATRAMTYYGRWPEGATLALVALYTGTALAMGLGLFSRLEDRFGEGL